MGSFKLFFNFSRTMQVSYTHFVALLLILQVTLTASVQKEQHPTKAELNNRKTGFKKWPKSGKNWHIKNEEWTGKFIDLFSGDNTGSSLRYVDLRDGELCVSGDDNGEKWGKRFVPDGKTNPCLTKVKCGKRKSARRRRKCKKRNYNTFQSIRKNKEQCVYILIIEVL